MILKLKYTTNKAINNQVYFQAPRIELQDVVLEWKGLARQQDGMKKV